MRLLSICAIVLMFAAIAIAQPSNGYVFFAPGCVSCSGHTAMTIQLGAGGEAVLGTGLGIGAELGALGTRQSCGNSVVGVFSPSDYYHFVHGKDIKADPFVTAGYTLLFGNGHASLFNCGGGLNYWLKHALGGRMELRDQVHTGDGPPIHCWGFRFGLVF
jgi:hypothetical protein